VSIVFWAGAGVGAGAGATTLFFEIVGFRAESENVIGAESDTSGL